MCYGAGTPCEMDDSHLTKDFLGGEINVVSQ